MTRNSDRLIEFDGAGSPIGRSPFRPILVEPVKTSNFMLARLTTSHGRPGRKTPRPNASADGPVIFDIGMASLMWGEVLLAAETGVALPPGVAFDADGNPTQDGRAAARGGVAAFGGHKGYGMAFAIQALGLLAGAAIPRGQVQDYGFLFLVVDPELRRFSTLIGLLHDGRAAELLTGDRVYLSPFRTER